MRLTKGVAEVFPNQAFEVIVANVSRQTRRLPKHTAVGFAKRNPLTILTPELQVLQGIALALQLTDLDDQIRNGGAGRRSPAEVTGASAGNRPTQCPLTEGGTVHSQEKDPK